MRNRPARRLLREGAFPGFVLLAGAAIAAPGPLLGLFESDRFRQLDELLPTPNAYRTASGAPGHDYWQQKVDYDIDVRLDDERQHLHGSERITYHNRSPDTLRYLWVQLDPNIFHPESHSSTTRTSPDASRLSYGRVRRLLSDFDGSCEITRVEAAGGGPLDHTIVDTNMRVDLPVPLAPGFAFTFDIDWDYAINDHDLVGGRTGYEFFEEDGNYLYEIAQWFPRLCVYSDATGWQNKAFLGSGEFTTEFGDYTVAITVPSDHVVASTGVLLNPAEVLSDVQQGRMKEAETAPEPIFIVTPDEAKANEKSRATETRTWRFQADDVRDFAWASSRKFIWDARLHPVEGTDPVLCMSFYPNEGEPLWSRYSTHAIQHTLDVYSRHTFPYPYPVAISVNGPVGGMEYPMICFNGPRPEKDGTYSERTKYGLISVIIHEVGHNYFPMIVNSDERQWTWMDEGLNTFLQFLAEQAWEEDYPSRRGHPENIVSYMKSDEQVPIMTAADSLVQGGSNAYAKPATALNILRETVLGRELFDFAFQEYARRWAFKHPMPADFFRTLEDASGVDLDWFWRGWFYTIDRCDIAIEGVRRVTIDSRNPEVEKQRKRDARDAEPITQTERRNQGTPRYIDRFPPLADFYNTYDELVVTDDDRESYEKLRKRMKDEDKAILDADLRFYAVDLKDEGGLVSPVVLKLVYKDGTEEERRIPAEVWRRPGDTVSTFIVAGERELVAVELDPHRETPDVDRSDNHFPPKIDEERVELREGFRSRSSGNPMRAAKEREEKKAKELEVEEKSNAGASGAGG